MWGAHVHVGAGRAAPGDSERGVAGRIRAKTAKSCSMSHRGRVSDDGEADGRWGTHCRRSTGQGPAGEGGGRGEQRVRASPPAREASEGAEEPSSSMKQKHVPRRR